MSNHPSQDFLLVESTMQQKVCQNNSLYLQLEKITKTIYTICHKSNYKNNKLLNIISPVGYEEDKIYEDLTPFMG